MAEGVGVAGELVMRNFRFTVEINDGVDGLGAAFAEVSGFDATYDIAEYRAGNDSYLTPGKYPGLVKYGNVTLKRGISDNNSFMQWLGQNIAGSIKKTTVTITLTDPASDQMVQWHLRNAWPVKYTGPDLNGNASEIAMETIELAHEGIDRDSEGGPGGAM